jgi:hypothetical protein
MEHCGILTGIESTFAHGTTQTAVLDVRTWLRRSGFNGIEDRRNAPNVLAWTWRENSAGHAHGCTTSLMYSAGHAHGCTTSLMYSAGHAHQCTTSLMSMARCLRAGRREVVVNLIPLSSLPQQRHP